MVEATLSKGLKRIIGLCPDIVLTADDILLIIDGKLNEVLAKAKGTYVEPEEHECDKCEKPIEEEDETGASIAIDTQDDKSFNEYFTTKQAD